MYNLERQIGTKLVVMTFLIWWLDIDGLVEMLVKNYIRPKTFVSRGKSSDNLNKPEEILYK